MDAYAKREIRLQQLTQRLMSGQMTSREWKEYDRLLDKKEAQDKSAMLEISRQQMRPRFPWFKRRRS